MHTEEGSDLERLGATPRDGAQSCLLFVKARAREDVRLTPGRAKAALATRGSGLVGVPCAATCTECRITAPTFLMQRGSVSRPKAPEHLLPNNTELLRATTVRVGAVCAHENTHTFRKHNQIPRCLRKGVFEETPRYSL